MKNSLIALIILCLGFSFPTARAEGTAASAANDKNTPGVQIAQTFP